MDTPTDYERWGVSPEDAELLTSIDTSVFALRIIVGLTVWAIVAMVVFASLIIKL